jgi:hypothetical protein
VEADLFQFGTKLTVVRRSRIVDTYGQIYHTCRNLCTPGRE